MSIQAICITIISLRFSNSESGLAVKDKYGYAKGFEVAGEDKKFYYAKAEIKDGQVVVFSPTVKKIIAVRYNWADDASDAEISECMVLLAQTEGIFGETAAGATVAVARKLLDQGRLPRDEEIVLCITGNGLKTQEAIVDHLEEAPTIKPSLAEFEPLLEQPVLV